MKRNLVFLTFIFLSAFVERLPASDTKIIGCNSEASGSYKYSLPTHLIERDRAMYLNFIVPSRFKVGESFANANCIYVQYILRDETQENWTEMINLTISSIVPRTLEIFLSKLKASLEEQYTPEKLKFSVLSCSEEKDVKIGIYSSDAPAMRGASKELIPNQRDNALEKLVLGDDVRYSIQYCISYPNETVAKKLQQKQQKFIENCKLLMAEECGIKSGVQAK